jgi:hypothetical protein
VVPHKKKKNSAGHALPMFNDPVSSPVLPKYCAPQSTNLAGVALKPLEIVKRSKMLTLYPDPFLVKSDILKLMKVGIDLVPFMTSKFLFACVPFLRKTELEKYHLQVIVDAIERNPHLVPKRTDFCICSFRPDAKLPFAWSRKTSLTWKEQNWLLIDELHSTHFISFGHSSFCLGYAQNVWNSKF